MTAQPATCLECSVRPTHFAGADRHLADYDVVPCPLHAGAEATAEEQDALLEALEEILGEATRGRYETEAKTRLACRYIQEKAFAAISAAQPKHAAQEGEAG